MLFLEVACFFWRLRVFFGEEVTGFYFCGVVA